MASLRGWWVSATLVLCPFLLLACFPDNLAPCKVPRDCINGLLEQHVCVYVDADGGYCAYPTLACPSGLKWSDAAREDLKGTCVNPDLLHQDAGIDGPAADGPPADAPAADGGGQ